MVVRRFTPLLSLLLVLPVGAQIISTVPIQNLPVTAKTKIAGQMIDLEVARTSLQQEIGLMGRKELAAHRGMLFVFPAPRQTAFWMGNCFIPLDMIFLRQGKVVSLTENALPCPKAQNCPQYSSKGVIDQVLELKTGQIKALNIKVNDMIEFTFLKTALTTTVQGKN